MMKKQRGNSGNGFLLIVFGGALITLIFAYVYWANGSLRASTQNKQTSQHEKTSATINKKPVINTHQEKKSAPEQTHKTAAIQPSIAKVMPAVQNIAPVQHQKVIENKQIAVPQLRQVPQVLFNQPTIQPNQTQPAPQLDQQNNQITPTAQQPAYNQSAPASYQQPPVYNQPRQSSYQQQNYNQQSTSSYQQQPQSYNPPAPSYQQQPQNYNQQNHYNTPYQNNNGCYQR